MRHCEFQRLRCSHDLAGKLSNQSPCHHEPVPPLDGSFFEDLLEAQPASWEHMWIDVGGEG